MYQGIVDIISTTKCSTSEVRMKTGFDKDPDLGHHTEKKPTYNNIKCILLGMKMQRRKTVFNFQRGWEDLNIRFFPDSFPRPP